VNVRNIWPGQQIVFPPLNNEWSPKRPVDGARTLVKDTREKLSSSTKIFTGSSVKPKRNQKKKKATRYPLHAVAVVKKGDTLEKLAKIVYGSSDPIYIQRVLDYNPQIVNPKKIFPGQDIVFPRIAEEVKALAKQSSQANSSK
jgi:nucleoid-associated protein YgaU